MNRLLRRIPIRDIRPRRGGGIDDALIEQARTIVRDVRMGGEGALRRRATEFGDIPSIDEPLLVSRPTLEAALAQLPAEDRNVLQRTAARIRAFARAQLQSITSFSLPIEAGVAQQRTLPLEVAGCYAPGGRFPLPSSVLMTTIPARVSGVTTVVVASPRPTQVTLAAAALGEADCLLAVGGAQAIAALAYGIGGIPAADVVVGPGNRWVTAAKHVVSADVRIDMLAGPSELVVVADESADPATVASDLLAQAEHDVDALPILIALSEAVMHRVEAELGRQLAILPTASIAHASLGRGFMTLAGSPEEAAQACDAIAPEHLQLSVRDPEVLAGLVHHFGGLFVGEASAEVLGDYGAGPNHVLPTGGSARHTAGLSVFSFLRIATVLLADREQRRAASRSPAADAAALARMEGLEGHARAAERRVYGG